MSLQHARASALRVLEYTVDEILKEVAETLTATPTPQLELDYKYKGTDPNIEAQIQKWINDLKTANPSTEPHPLDQVWTTKWKPIVKGAETQWVGAATELVSNATSQNDVSAAHDNGVAAGDKAPLPENSDLSTLEANGKAATQAGGFTRTTAIALNAATKGVETALEAISNPAEANTAVTNIQTLINEAKKVMTAANAAVKPITEAAKSAKVEKRLAMNAAEAEWVARFPGAAGNATIQVSGRLGANVLQPGESGPVVSQIRNGDLVVIKRGSSALIHEAKKEKNTWTFTPGRGSPLPLNSLNSIGNDHDHVIPLTLSVEIRFHGKFAQSLLWGELTVSDLATRLRDSATQVFATKITNRMQELETPVILRVRKGKTLVNAQLAANLVNLEDWSTFLNDKKLSITNTFLLDEGSDGKVPPPIRYEGTEDDRFSTKSGLYSLEDLEEIAIVAAPGYSYDWRNRRSNILTISQTLINHCERMRYRVAILDSPDNQPLSGVREYRALLDNTRAAVYYPWVLVNDPITNQDLSLPPSGFVAGIYARNDVEIGVHKAPANEVVRNAIGLEVLINKAQQDVLNPLGINCIRFLEGRGIRVWGARTVSSDPEWKYLNIRRYLAYLEASIDRSTQWAVFEPNGERLWANVRRTVESFLENEWREGRLAGVKIEQAFSVQCDRSTMTQNDLDNGRLICQIGVSPLYPAEFVIFRIGQWTADRR